MFSGDGGLQRTRETHLGTLKFAAEGRKPSLVPFRAKRNSIKREARAGLFHLACGRVHAAADVSADCGLNVTGSGRKTSETRFSLKITSGVGLRWQTTARSRSCVSEGQLLTDSAAGRPHSSSASPCATFKPLLQCTCLITRKLKPVLVLNCSK